MINQQNDAFGEAVKDYHFNKNTDANIIVKADILDDDVIPVNYLFRSYEKMPELEKEALALCKGKVLDVGAGVGSHSLHLQQKGIDVTAIDISKGTVDVMNDLGIENSIQTDFFTFSGSKFDTILSLMNGTGIAGTLNGLEKFLAHAKTLLSSEGCILVDSSDIKYLYEDDDGSFWFDLNSEYYGIIEYTMKYNEITSDPFKWLFVDKSTLATYAKKNGYNCEILFESDHHEYLARLKPIR